MSSTEVSLSFDELKAQNVLLENQLNFVNKCLNVLIKFKLNINNILDNISHNQIICLTSQDILMIEKLEEEYNEVTQEVDSIESKQHLLNNQFLSPDLKSLILSAKKSSVVVECNELQSNDQIVVFNAEKGHHLRQHQKTNQLKSSESKQKSLLTKLVTHSRRSYSSKVLDELRDTEDNRILIFKSGPTSAEELESKKCQFRCNVDDCYQEFESRPRLVSHQKEFHKEYFPFKCESCDSIFRFESKLNRHKEEVHIKTLLICPSNDCNQEFETTIRLMSHKKECHKDLFPFHCIVDTCDSIFRYKAELVRHLLEVHKKWIKCPTIGCNYETDQRIELRVHQQKCHQKKSIKKFKCSHESCGSSFVTSSRLKRHLSEVHMNERRFICDHPNCGKGFKTGNALKVHKIIHSDETPFKCEFIGCNYNSKSVHRLKLHQKNHSKDRPFVCEFEGCVERFKNKSTLQSHMNTHSNESPVVCPVDGCGKYFRPHTMRAHVLMHSKEVIYCDWPGCHYETKGQNKLRQHKKMSHSSEKNFVCDWDDCQKRFKTNYHLNLHYKSHTNDKPYLCQWPGCEYRSCYSANIRIHSRIHYNEKPFVCQWPGCEYRCAVTGNLKKHMKTHQKKSIELRFKSSVK